MTYVQMNSTTKRTASACDAGASFACADRTFGNTAIVILGAIIVASIFVALIKTAGIISLILILTALLLGALDLNAFKGRTPV